MGGVLVFSENSRVSFELLNKAAEIARAGGSTVSLALPGKEPAESFLKRGAQKVYIPRAGQEALQDFEAGAYAEALAQIAQAAGASLILLGCTRRGKELAGRLAQKLAAGCINDAIDLEVKDGRVVCRRYALGGMTVMTQEIGTAAAVVSVMPRAFDPAPEGEAAGEVVEIDLEIKPSRVRLVERQSKAADSTDISEAEVLVCVGKGMEHREDLPLAEELAGMLGGEVACSKPVATDQKWLSEDRIVGLSGKKCKPQLAICLGISGQVQFNVGIRDARTLVAVNSDPNAYIFQISDYGIVGDLHEVVPRIISGLKK
ncbi:MAG: electron transfer flavoprotein subunit alpha/FixB family protein [Firmicutes bacterium]|nr:electron transfer flavoprotein subunit alpha/FixB family protein [Bacillota bacterium]